MGSGAWTRRLEGEFYRFFCISGMSHCGSGNGATFISHQSASTASLALKENVLMAMVRWVEGEVAPDTIMGTSHNYGTKDNATYQTTTMATSHSATVEDDVLEDRFEKVGVSQETEKPLLAYKPEEEMFLWKNQSPIVLWQLQLFLEALVAAHEEAEDCMIDLEIDTYLTKRWRRRKRAKYTRGLAVYKAQRKAVLKIEIGVIRDGNMGEALQAAFDRVQIALIENMTRVNVLLSML
ncbi:hypothetical protein CFIO01_01848 [Colletotrichum fioriniae PJ7]|uniref:Carboxylic ester hydrolase n=1 Tax=Colletotrichum fioriniae PJ7 TaxID=1445577 RepID=A0A010SCD5_9PEZI|nr:hypothetical protein CFIO01_01848 [Colletotrichum fioriniae PJ7]